MRKGDGTVIAAAMRSSSLATMRQELTLRTTLLPNSDNGQLNRSLQDVNFSQSLRDHQSTQISSVIIVPALN